MSLVLFWEDLGSARMVSFGLFGLLVLFGRFCCWYWWSLLGFDLSKCLWYYLRKTMEIIEVKAADSSTQICLLFSWARIWLVKSPRRYVPSEQILETWGFHRFSQ